MEVNIELKEGLDSTPAHLSSIGRLIDCLFTGMNDVGGVPVLLSPGIHSFPFKLGLPLGLPSTFLGKHGWVQYYCKTALRYR